MDKSDPEANNTVFLLDDPKVMTKKFKSATTDSGSEIKFSEDKPGVANLLTIYSALSGKSIKEVEAHFTGKMYGHLKVELAELAVEKLTPVQDEYKKLMQDKKYLFGVIHKSAEKAAAHAEKTLARVYDRLGLVPRA
jgi:tryptophanyl-tRNA synthetase